MKTIFNNKSTQKDKEKKDTSLIFLVDDNPVFLNILELDLSDLSKTEFMIFNTGEECLKHMHLNPLIVVLDYDLKGDNPDLMNGIEVLRNIKKSYPEIEVIMLSGCDDVSVATASIKFGAFDYVVKNESALINVRNKIHNIFRRFRILKSLKEEKMIKWTIVGILSLIVLFGVFSGKIMRYI